MKKSTVILLWGGITGIASALFYQILNATGQENSPIKWFWLLILFAGLFMGTRQVRDKANGGYLTFGEGFKTGFFMVLIIALIGIIGTIIDMQMHPDFTDKILEQARNNMINQGRSEKEIEIGMHYTQMFTTPFMIVVWVIVGNLFFGAILSLITSGISTKNKPMFEDAGEAPSNDNNS